MRTILILIKSKRRLILQATGFILILTGLMGMGILSPEITHGVEIRNECKNKIDQFHVEYGKNNFPYKEGQTFGYLSTRIYSMPMRIPEVAKVSWKEQNGMQHNIEVPVKALIKTREILGDSFTVVFNVCNDKLTVNLEKRIGYAEYRYRQLWPKIL